MVVMINKEFFEPVNNELPAQNASFVTMYHVRRENGLSIEVMQLQPYQDIEIISETLTIPEARIKLPEMFI